MIINDEKYALIAEDEIPLFKKKIEAAIFVTSVVKEGNVLTVKGEGFAGLKPGSSEWLPQSLLFACEQARTGARNIPYDIKRDNGEAMRGFLRRIEESEEIAAAGEKEGE